MIRLKTNKNLWGVLLIYLLTFFGILLILGVFTILLSGVFISGIKVGKAGIMNAFTFSWNPEEKQFGILQMLLGSVLLSLIATAISFTIAMGALGRIWGSKKENKLLKATIKFMTGIPTVVYGFVGLFLLVPFMRNHFDTSGFGLISSAIVLSFLILPTIVIPMDSALEGILTDVNVIKLHCLSLGMNDKECFWNVSVPMIKEVIKISITLGFSRAIGDTMIALMLSGNTPLIPVSPFSTIRTLPSHIALMTATEISSQIEFTMFLACFWLLVMTVITGVIINKAKSIKIER